MGRLRDPVARRPWDQMMGRSRDVGQKYVFQIQLTNTANLIWQVTQDIITAPKMKFFIKDIFSKYDQICSFLRVCSHLL